MKREEICHWTNTCEKLLKRWKKTISSAGKPFQTSTIILKSSKIIATWEFFTEEDFNPQKQVFLFNLRFWLAQKLKFRIFSTKCLYNKNLLCKSEGHLVWKWVVFLICLLCLYLFHRSCGIYYGLVADMWDLKRSSVSLALKALMQSSQNFDQNF